MRHKLYFCLFLFSITIANNIYAQCDSVFVPNRTACAGSCTNVTVSMFNGTPPFSYNWSDGQTGSSVLLCPTVTTTYTVTITDNMGCSTTANPVVSVIPAPVISIVRPLSICLGNSVILNATGGVNYSWAPNPTISCSSCPSPVATPTTTTTYTVLVTDANGCSAIDTVTVFVNIPPTVIASTDKDTLCNGVDCATLTVSAPGASSISWSNGATGNQISACFPTTYVVVGTDLNNCTGADTVVIHAKPYAGSSLTISPDVTVCNGTNVQLNVTGGSTYTWTPSTGLSNTTIANPIASPTTTTEYNVTVGPADINGCFGALSTKVTIFNSLQVYTTSKLHNICSGGKAQLLARGALKYSWSPSTGLSHTGIADPIAQPLFTTTYTVTGMDSAGGCLSTDTVRVNVNPFGTAPVVTISPDTTVCKGFSAKLIGNATGDAPFKYQWSSFYFDTMKTVNVNPTITTVYTLTVTDANGCTDFAYTRVNVVSKCNNVVGVAFIDYNSNNIFDAGDVPMTNASITSKGSGFTTTSFTNTAGQYDNLADVGAVITSPAPKLYYSITPAQFNSNFSGYGNTDTANFAFVPAGIFQDLQITIVPTSNARPGRQVNYRIVYTNVGTKVMSGSVFMTHDSRTTFISSIPTNNSVNGNKIEWIYSNLLPNESRTIDVFFNVTSTIAIGSFLIHQTYIDPVGTDSMPSDNYSNVEHEVTGGYDPNDKQMTAGKSVFIDSINAETYFTYMIRFQNTGNDTTFLVVIRDTLDSKLDGSTFEMINASHTNYSVVVEDNKYVTWTFQEIMLPDSNVDEPGSHGYVSYRVKPVGNIKGGDVVNNTAHIFFDYNLPVATNTERTFIAFPENIHMKYVGKGDLSVYPNPTTGVLNIMYSVKAYSHVNVELINSLGEKIRTLFAGSKSAGQQLISYDTQDLPAGIYFIRLTSNGNNSSVKLLKY